MVRSVIPYAKKLFSLALLFNALLTLEYSIQLLASFYSVYPNWKPFPPFIFDGSLFWLIIPAALINFFPAVTSGQTKCNRLWFHHYVYGCVIALVAGASLLVFTTVPVLDLVTKNITDVNINVGRFFVMGGLTLVIDDLPDVSGVMEKTLNYLKLKAFRGRKALHITQFLFGCISLYFCLGVIIHILIAPVAFTLANTILVGTMLVTSLTAFASVKRRIWLNMTSVESVVPTKSKC